MSDFHSDIVDRLNRRRLLARCGGGAGMLGLAALLADEGLMAPSAFADAATDRKLNPLAPAQPHFTARAKSVIWLFMNGWPSQVDTWNYRPELAKRDGQELEGFDKNTGFFTAQVGPLMKSPFQWSQHGESGTWVSEIFRTCRNTSTRWRSSTPAGPSPTTTAPRCS